MGTCIRIRYKGRKETTSREEREERKSVKCRSSVVGVGVCSKFGERRQAVSIYDS